MPTLLVDLSVCVGDLSCRVRYADVSFESPAANRTMRKGTSAQRTLRNFRRQSLSHFDFRAVVDRPGGRVRDGMDQPGRTRMAVAALLDAA